LKEGIQNSVCEKKDLIHYYHADRPWTLCSSRDKVPSLAGQTSVVSSCDAHDPTWRQATW